MRAKAISVGPSSLVALALCAVISGPALGAPGDPAGLQILDSEQGAFLSTSQSGLPGEFANQLGLPVAFESQQPGEPLLALGPITSIESDWTAVRVASTDILVLPKAVITTLDGQPLGRDALKVGDLVAVGGDALGGNAGLGRRVVLLGAPFVPGATLTYMRTFARGEEVLPGSLSSNHASSGWIEVVCSTGNMNGPCTALVASALASEEGDSQRSESAKGISGSGIRAKGISGSGIRAKGISGSGIRAKGISGSGIRTKASDSSRAN